ncbi:MAG TPA: hypothetical protein VEI02_08575 [Planctomycetota bacterium]|nr:hypothetical protein [Planctomycetota bacterium]
MNLAATKVAAARPIYVIAHMCNTPAYVEAAVRAGANAVECDVRARHPTRIDLHFHHGFSVPYPARSPVRTPLREQARAIRSLGDACALFVVDCKPLDGADYRAYGRALGEGLGAELEAARVLVSVGATEMLPVFDGIADVGFAAGRDVSMIDNDPRGERADRWIDFAERHDLTALGIGTDSHVPFDRLKRWIAPLRAAVRGRDARGRVRKVYYWTVKTRSSMRRLLDLELDGMIVNHPARLRAVLSEPPYAARYRLATPADSQFVVHASCGLAAPDLAAPGSPRG